MHPARRVAARAVIAIVILAMTAACTTTQGSDKTGGDTVVLTLATFDGQPPNSNGLYVHGPAAFVEQPRQGLRRTRQGRAEDRATAATSAADAESKVVRAIAAGEVDGGWPSTRAFARGWVPGLEVVEAPLTITSYAAQKALVSGPVAGKLLARLEGSGMVGLGLAVGPLRRPFAANQPLLGPEDWKGITFRVFNSPTQADAVRALGATPADVSFSWVDQINEGTLRGGEFDIAGYEQQGGGTEAGNVTANVVLWPKVFVLALSQKRFDALTSQQQGWVREAAAQAVKASVDATYDETPAARTLCERGRPLPGRHPRPAPRPAQPVPPGARQARRRPDQRPAARRPPGDRRPAPGPRHARRAGQLRQGHRQIRVAWPGSDGRLGPPRRGVPPPAHPRRGRRRRAVTVAPAPRGPGRSGSAAGPSSSTAGPWKVPGGAAEVREMSRMRSSRPVISGARARPSTSSATPR